MQAPVTQDALFGGALRLLQPARGYRVNVDSLLLASFALVGARARLALDLGSGVGALALSLHFAGGAERLALVEREAALAGLARQNLGLSGAPGTVYEVDLAARGLPRALLQRADLVVCNPPFFPAGSSRRRSPDPTREGSLPPFLAAAARALRSPRSRACFAYPARSLSELLALARAERLVAKRLRLVHARATDPARLALVELRAARPGGLVVEPPLVEWVGRARTPELAAIVAGTPMPPNSGDRLPGSRH